MNDDPDNYWEVDEIRRLSKPTRSRSDLERYFLRLLEILEEKLEILRTNQRELIISTEEDNELVETPFRSEVIEIGNLDITTLLPEELVRHCRSLAEIHNDFLLGSYS